MLYGSFVNSSPEGGKLVSTPPIDDGPSGTFDRFVGLLISSAKKVVGKVPPTFEVRIGCPSDGMRTPS